MATGGERPPAVRPASQLGRQQGAFTSETVSREHYRAYDPNEANAVRQSPARRTDNLRTVGDPNASTDFQTSSRVRLIVCSIFRVTEYFVWKIYQLLVWVSAVGYLKMHKRVLLEIFMQQIASNATLKFENQVVYGQHSTPNNMVLIKIAISFPLQFNENPKPIIAPLF